MADLHVLLGQIEDAEARLRPLIREAREAIQDLKTERRDLEELVRVRVKTELDRRVAVEVDRMLRELGDEQVKIEVMLRRRVNEIATVAEGYLEGIERVHDTAARMHDVWHGTPLDVADRPARPGRTDTTGGRGPAGTVRP